MPSKPAVSSAQSILLALTAIFVITSATPAQALIVWGYDKNNPAMEKKYRSIIVDYGPQCLTLRRNLDPTFILAADRDYLSGIGTRVFTSTPICVSGMDHATVTLVTPKHLLVAEHYGIWNQANTFAFVGTDNKMYLARNKPGFIRLKDLSNSYNNPTDIALVELETALPPAVVPLHVANFTPQHRQQVTEGMPSYHAGNMHLSPSVSMFNSFGNGNYKGLGTNKIKVTSWGYLSYGINPINMKRPTNPSSLNWADYWQADRAPLPPEGTAFATPNDSSAPVLIKIKDAANRTRVHVIGFHWGIYDNSVIGYVYTDLVAKIAAYNAANGTNYSINNTALNPIAPPPTVPRIIPTSSFVPVKKPTSTSATKPPSNFSGTPKSIEIK